MDDEYRSTPLGVAARRGQGAMVELLLERGADATATGASWSAPLAWAAKKGQLDIVDVLRAAGAAGADRKAGARQRTSGAVPTLAEVGARECFRDPLEIASPAGDNDRGGGRPGRPNTLPVVRPFPSARVAG